MKRLLNFTILLSFLAFAAFTAVGQDDERHKAEGYAGYSYMNIDTGIDEDFDDFDSRIGAHGFNGSITGNVRRYWGIKFDFSTHSKSESFADGLDTLNLKIRTNQFLGGVQVKDNHKEGGRVRPFGHALFGVANQRATASGTFTDPGGGGSPQEGTGGGTVTTFNETESFNNFAMVIGGGIDVNVSRRVAIRIIQLDYNAVFFRRRDDPRFNIPGRTQNNFRFGVGVVFH